MLVLTLAGCGQGLSHDDLPYYAKPSVGVIFRPVTQKLYATGSKRHMLFSMALPKLPKLERIEPEHICETLQHIQIQKRNPLIMHICDKVKDEYILKVGRYNNLVERVLSQESTLQGLSNDFVINTLSKKRNILSPLYKLMGIADSDQINNLYDHIKIIKSNRAKTEQELQAVKRGYVQLANTTVSELSTIWKNLRATQSFVANSSAAMAHWRALVVTKLKQIKQGNDEDISFVEKSLHLMTHIETEIDELLKLDIELGRWITSLLTLSRGYLDPFLVPKDMLVENLQNVKQSLKRIPGSHFLVNDELSLTYYYRQKLTTMMIHDGVLYLHVTVAISNRDIKLDIYQIITLPASLHSATAKGQIGFSALDTEFSYFGVSQNNEFYAEISSSELELCALSGDSVCQHTSVLHDRSNYTCLAAIFYEDESKITSRCVFRYFPTTGNVKILHVTKQIYIVAQASTDVIVTCPEKIVRKQVAPYFILRIPCGCSVSCGDVKITQQISECSFEDQTVEIKHVINYAQIIHFDIKKFAPEITMKSLYNEIPIIPVGNMTRFLHAANISEIDRKLGVDIRKLAQLMNEEPTHYEVDNLPSPLDTEFTLQWEMVLILISLGIAHVITVVTLVALGFRIQTIQAAILLMTSKYGDALHVTKPSDVDISDVTTEEVFTQSQNVSNNYDDNQTMILTMLGILCCYLILKALTKIYTSCRNVCDNKSDKEMHACHSNLFLSIHTSQDCTPLLICKIPLQIGKDLHFSKLPRPINIDLVQQGLLNVKIRIVWDSHFLNYHFLDNEYNILLPRVIFQRFWKVGNLKSILALGHKSPYYAVWVAKSVCRCDTKIHILHETSLCACLSNVIAHKATQTPLYKLPGDPSFQRLSKAPSVVLIGAENTQLELVEC